MNHYSQSTNTLEGLNAYLLTYSMKWKLEEFTAKFFTSGKGTLELKHWGGMKFHIVIKFNENGTFDVWDSDNTYHLKGITNYKDVLQVVHLISISKKLGN